MSTLIGNFATSAAIGLASTTAFGNEGPSAPVTPDLDPPHAAQPAKLNLELPRDTFRVRHESPTSEGRNLAVDLLKPAAIGLVAPAAERILNGKAPDFSCRDFAANWRNAKHDFSITGANPKRDVWMHGPIGAYVGYLPMRGNGYSVGESALGAATVGLAMEVGQACEVGHLPDAGDIMRTTLYGVIIGEGLHQVNKWADRNGYTALSVITNPSKVRLGVDRDSQNGNRVFIEYRATFP